MSNQYFYISSIEFLQRIRCFDGEQVKRKKAREPNKRTQVSKVKSGIKIS